LLTRSFRRVYRIWRL